MTTTAPETSHGENTDDQLPCSSEGCPNPAVEMLGFRDQDGHVHDCASHAAQLREWCDVTHSAPIRHGRCPLTDCAATGTWVATPTRLEP